MTRPWPPSVYLNGNGESYPSAGDLRDELAAWDELSDEAIRRLEELDITSGKGRRLVEAHRVVSAGEATLLSVKLSLMGFEVRITPVVEEDNG